MQGNPTTIPNVDPVAQSTMHAPDLRIYDLLEAQATRTPDAIAIAAAGRKPLTYRRLVRQVNEAVNALRSMGVGRNDRVGVVLPNGPEMAVAFLAVAAGATCAPLNPAFRANEFDLYLSDLKAKALIVQSGVDSPAITIAHKQSIPIIELSPLEKGEAGTFSIRGENQPAVSQGGLAEAEDIALILYTSGTTSRPKMVPLTHSNLLSSASNIAVTLQLTEKDRCLNLMPLFHIHGLVGAVLASMRAGSSVICSSGFDPEKFFSWLEEFHPTWYTAVPTTHHAVLSCAATHKELLQRCSLRFIRSSSAALPPQVMQGLEEVFRVPVIEAYGMTEASHQIACNPLPPGRRKPRSVGLPAGVEVAVFDDEGNVVSPGETGEIVIRGTTVMSGYGNSPQANEESFKHGWFRTGDQGHLDADGYLFLTGRLHETISRGGAKISPAEVDEVLKEHPDVSEAVTFAVPHATLGQDIAAAIVLREKALVTEAEIQRFVATRLAEFKIPRRVLIVDRISKGATGKIQRIGLAEKMGLTGNVQTTAPRVEPRTPVETMLAAIWAQVLNLDQIGIHDNFFDLGGNSLLAFMVTARIAKTFGKHLHLTTVFHAPTIEKLASLLQQEEWSSPWSSVVPLQTGGSKPPFFWVHGQSSDALLPRYLGTDQPLYGLMHQSQTENPPSIPELTP